MKNIEKKIDDKENILVSSYVAETYNNACGIVTIISDDGVFKTGINLNHLMKKYDLKCTIAGAIKILKPRLWIWKFILKNNRLDMINHSYNHIPMSDEDDIASDIDSLNFEIEESSKCMNRWFGIDKIAFVCPENKMCKQGYDILEKNGYWAVRRGERGLNTCSPQNGTEPGEWYNLKVHGICDSEVDDTTRRSWVDEAIDNKLWLIEMWHNVMKKDDGGYQTILIPDAESHLAYIKSKVDTGRLWCATFSDAVKYIREKQNAIIQSYIRGEYLYIELSLKNEKMDYSIFNHPLTVILDMPNGYNIDNNENNDRYVMVNIKPGEIKKVKITKREK